MTGYEIYTSDPDVEPSINSETHNHLAVANGTGVPSWCVGQRQVDIQQLFSRAHIEEELSLIEQLLLGRTISQSTPIAAAGAHIVRSGGKRLRAALTLLAAQLGAYSFEQTKHAAAAVELIHAASLVHDDLVDRTHRRRGHVTVHARWDNDVALMLGDYFFALAAAEMALCSDPRIIMFYAQAVQTIVTGELHPVTVVEPFDIAMRQYLYKTGAKTAALFEAGCKAGITTSGGSDEEIAALGQYGYDLGLAFQIVDDILDFIGNEQVLGKPAGNDLRQGTITLPIIYAVANSDSQFLRELVYATNVSDTQVLQAIGEVVLSGGVQQAQAEAARYVASACAHLDRFPATNAKHALLELAQFVLTRQV